MKFFCVCLNITLLIGILACSEDARQSARIPPLSNLDAEKQAQAGVEFLSRAIRRRPSVAQNYGKRADLYLLLQQHKEALNDINKALGISPNSGLFLFIRAQVLRQLKQYDQALADARQAEVLNQNTPELYTLLGDLTQQKGQYLQSKLYLAKALQIAPYDGEAYFYNGALLARQGDTTSAIALMQRSIELKPRFLNAYVALTTIHTNLRDYPQAMAYNAAGLRYFPVESGLHYTRGGLYHAKKQLDSALMCYGNAVKFDSANYLAHFQAGIIYLKWNNVPLAIQNFEQVARLDAKFPQIDFLLGTAFDRAGNVDKALEHYTLATQTNPSDYKAQAGLVKAQRRKYYLEVYGYLTPAGPAAAINETAPVISERRLDTARVQIKILQPRLEIKTRTDTNRTFRIK